MKQTLAMGVLFGVVLAHAAVGFFGWQEMLESTSNHQDTITITIKHLGK